MSSDGQSIPFGTNWIHKIENGLKQASIMFVFVTPNSITSNWIYFEAGYAYSKSIEVIPVGIGIDIALLKAPLSLLQGFNISSGDGINNIISVINKKFDYHFGEAFSEEEYRSIVKFQDMHIANTELSEIFDSADYEIAAEYSDGKGGKIVNNIDTHFNKIIEYLSQENVNYTFNDSSNEKIVLVYGIKIDYKVGKKQGRDSFNHSEIGKICFTISPYNFKQSFTLFSEITQLSDKKDKVYLRFGLTSNYSFIKKHEHLASIMSMFPETFSFSNNRIGGFIFNENKIEFSIFDMNRLQSNKIERYVIGVLFDPKESKHSDVQKLLYALVDKKVIFRI